MTTRQTVTIQGQEDRDQIARWARNVESGTIVEFRKKTRSHEQNAKLHAMLGEVSDQVVWYGQKLKVEDWKNMFSASLRKAQVVPGIDPGTVVPLGIHTSTMTIDEMSNMIELIYAFGADPEHPVTFRDPNTEASGTPSPERPDEGDTPAPAMAPAHAEVSPEPVAQPPSPEATGSSDFGKFQFGEGEQQHLKDLARKALDDAASDADAPAKDAAIAKLFDGYADVIESSEGRTAMAAMSKPLVAVVDGNRTREQAAAYIAREILDCPVSDLEGRK